MGRPLRAIDLNLTANHTVQHDFFYDSLGNILKEIQEIDGETATIERAFDHVGNRLSLTYDNGRQIAYDYENDALDRLRDLKDNGASLATWDYLGTARQARALTTLNGAQVVSTRTFDPVKRIEALRHTLLGPPEKTHLDFAYAYDRMDNLQYEQRNHRDVMEAQGTTTGDVYFYDPLYRVKEARYRAGDVFNELSHPEGPKGVQSRILYGLDEAGNWTTLTDLGAPRKRTRWTACPRSA